jgi:hypothetical protein
MAVLPFPTAGDSCFLEDTFNTWVAIPAATFPTGANCINGVGVQWLYPIGSIAGTAALSGGTCTVSIPNFPTGSIVFVFPRAPPIGILSWSSQNSSGFTVISTYNGDSIGFNWLAVLPSNGGTFTILSQPTIGASVDLSNDSSIPISVIILPILTPNSFFGAMLDVRIWITKSSDHAIKGPISIEAAMNIDTDSSGNPTCTFNATIEPDETQLPAALNGADATVTPSSGGFTIFANRPAGIDCKAKPLWIIDRYEDLT